MNWILLAVIAVVDWASAAGALSADAPLSGPHATPPAMAGMPSASSDPAAAARNSLTKEAIALLQRSEQGGGYAHLARPWHEARWLNLGAGKVGRLCDLCRGAVEPPPALARGARTWDTMDPRGLSPTNDARFSIGARNRWSPSTVAARSSSSGRLPGTPGGRSRLAPSVVWRCARLE